MRDARAEARRAAIGFLLGAALGVLVWLLKASGGRHTEST